MLPKPHAVPAISWLPIFGELQYVSKFIRPRVTLAFCLTTCMHVFKKREKENTKRENASEGEEEEKKNQ